VDNSQLASVIISFCFVSYTRWSVIGNQIKQQIHMATSKSKRGFAAMSKEKRQAIARQGGKASHGGGRKSSGGRSKSR
jgi:hypothetical protein